MLSWTELILNSEKTLDHEAIDEFLQLLNTSANNRLRKFTEESDNLTEAGLVDPGDLQGYRDYLAERIATTQSVRDLGNQLGIVALYKMVEGQTMRIVKKRLPSVNARELSSFKSVGRALHLNIENLQGYPSLNELRLLNNSIKHGGVVSAELSKEFPRWSEGDLLDSVGNAYERLLPGVEEYMRDLATQIHEAETRSLATPPAK